MLSRHDLSTPAEPVLVVTPANPSDLDALIALFDRSSLESRRRRFHGSVRRIPSDYLQDILRGAPGVVARVARNIARDPSGRCVIALATAALESPDRAELAVWVDDEWQRRGVGSLLIRAVVDQLRADSVSTAVAYLDPANVAAHALARSLARWLDAPDPNGPAVTFDLTHVTREVAV